MLPQRGAHTFFLRMGKVGRWAGYMVNLIHYEDAAALSAAVCSHNQTVSQATKPPLWTILSLEFVVSMMRIVEDGLLSKPSEN